MHEWFDLALMQWKAGDVSNNPGLDPPIIGLDAYYMHLMGSIVYWIQAMGIEVARIPKGCTYLYQPIDVGLNNPIKCCFCEKWRGWMMEGRGVVDCKEKEPCFCRLAG